jgi:cobalt-zinc-cadmium efflux system outer membrane protein
MSTTKRFILLASFSALAAPAFSAPKDPPFAPVEKAVKERSSLAVRWQQDADAREESLRTVRVLLKKPLSAKAAMQIAALNNRDLLATFEDIGVSAADLREAGLLKNPAIDLSVRFPDRKPAGTDWEEAAAFDLLDLLMLPLRKRVAAERLASAQFRVADEVLKLVAETKIAVHVLQADGELTGRLRLILDTSAVSLELAQGQHEAGNITDLELLRQQAAYNGARLELAGAEAEQGGHREKLNRLLGLWGADTGWKITPQLPQLPEKDVPLKGLESLAIAQRLDLAAAHADLTGLVRALGLTKTYRYVGALEFGMDTEREREGDNLTGPKLRLELPVFNQGKARIAKGEAELRRAERKLEGLAIDIRSSVRELHDRLAAKREVVQFYHGELLPTYAAIVQQSLLRYNGMLIGNYELFATRGEQVMAEKKSIEALRDYWITRDELERTVGGSLSARKPPSSSKN